MLKKFTDYIKKNNTKYVVNLNPNGIEFDVLKICDVKLVQNFFKDDDIFINESDNFFLSVFPDKLKLFINLFSDTSLTDVYDKINDFGLAVQTCFKDNFIINKIIYSTYDTNENENIEKDLLNESYLVIENNKIIKFLNKNDMDKLKNAKNYLETIQIISGLSLYKDGNPFIDIDKMKDIIYENKPISGKNVIINYNDFLIKFDNNIYRFKDIGNKFKFKYPEFFNTNNAPLVIGINKNNNNFILYHDHIDIYNLMKLLLKFECKNAILICNNLNTNILWKGMNEKTLNTYNKTDFIGNPDETLSNIILFTK